MTIEKIICEFQKVQKWLEIKVFTTLTSHKVGWASNKPPHDLRKYVCLDESSLKQTVIILRSKNSIRSCNSLV